LKPVVIECRKLFGGGDGAGDNDVEREDWGGRDGEWDRDIAGDAEDEPDGDGVILVACPSTEREFEVECETIVRAWDECSAERRGCSTDVLGEDEGDELSTERTSTHESGSIGVSPEFPARVSPENPVLRGWTAPKEEDDESAEIE
jgi:hypothetical protein